MVDQTEQEVPVAETSSVQTEAVAPEVVAEAAPPAPLGTAELKAVLALMVDSVKIGVEAMKDGKVSLGDLPLLVKLVPDLIPAVAGLSKVPAELSDLTEAEAEDVLAFVASKLAVNSEKATKVVAASLKLLVGVVGLVESLRA